MKKKILIFAVVAILLLTTLTSCDATVYEANGFSVELPFGYIDVTEILGSGTHNLKAMYLSPIEMSTVVAIRTPYYELGGEYTAEEYADVLTDVVTVKGDIFYINGNPAVEYDESENGMDLSLLAVCVADGIGVWMITFACLEDSYDDNRDNFISYAETIKVAQ